MNEEAPISVTNGAGQASNGRRPVGRAEVPPRAAEGQAAEGQAAEGQAAEGQAAEGQSRTQGNEVSELNAPGSAPEGATAGATAEPKGPTAEPKGPTAGGATAEGAPPAPEGARPGEEDADAALAELAQKTLSELERERDEYLDMLRRLQAEFENYRKRIERNQREMVEHANAALVKKLLPVLDTADLALAHGAGEDVKQVAAALFDVLCKEGLERIDPEGESFDPEHHDAVAHEPVEGGEAPARPEVSEVMRAGYRWKGRVLRPAMVKVRG